MEKKLRIQSYLLPSILLAVSVVLFLLLLPSIKKSVFEIKESIFQANLNAPSIISPRTYYTTLPEDRSADFGTYIHLPRPIDQIPEKFTFVIPYPSPSVFDLLRPIRAEIKDFSVFYNAYYFSPGNLFMNALPWQTWESLMANNSNWVLWSELVFEYGTGYYLADPGADGYAEAWADAAIASAQAEQTNWIFIDSINQTLLWTLSAGKRPADFKYPENDDTAWRAAITHFVSVVSGKARAAGLKLAVNTGTGLGKGFSGSIDSYVDAYMEERFANSRTAYPELMPKNHPASTIDTQIIDSQSSNKRLILVSQANTNDPLYDQRAKFALAMYLIARKTDDVLILYENNLHTFWYPDFTAAQTLGRILSAPTKVNNVWMREYEKAIILLNATDSAQNMPAQAGSGSISGRTGMIISKTSTDTTQDITPPTGTVSINNGALTTNTTAVTLTLSAADDTGSGTGSGVQMQFSNNAVSWSSLEPFAATKSWGLDSGGEGMKTVYVKYKDGAGNWSVAVIYDTIILDTTASVIEKPIEKPIDETNIEELLAKIRQLQAQIASIQAQIAQAQAQSQGISAIPADYKFVSPLYQGLRSTDVKYLQIFLKSQGTEIYSRGLITGYFGLLTRTAVINFQVKQKIIPSAYSRGAGLVGIKTRAKINEILGR